MIKEFIPYEEALELKELGFDEPCIMQWTYAPELIFCTSAWGRPKFKTNKESYSDSGGDCISAPTFSQAFRWFREKHNLHCEIGCAQNQFFFRVGKVDSFPHILDDNNRRYYTNCEEAELAALIKLIKVITNE